ncbi:MAG: sel1 repeat family protein [Deltaproteobacteria bacterium]|nr:sel1 repeat family protein [Deltaproteobacteria bacterium]
MRASAPRLTLALLGAAFAASGCASSPPGDARPGARDREIAALRACEPPAPGPVPDGADDAARCLADDPLACRRAADRLLRDPRAGSAESERALALLERACRACEGDACYLAGSMLDMGFGVGKDERRANDHYVRGCALASPDACHALGVNQELGVAQPASAADAAATYRRACDLGSLPGCTALGTMYARGLGVAGNMPEARLLWEVTCEHDEPRACAHLGFLFASGTGGVPQDTSKAASLFARACMGGDGRSCEGLGLFYLAGEGVSHDGDRARRLFQIACDAGAGTACARLQAGTEPE